jgi:hypothetical protein
MDDRQLDTRCGTDSLSLSLSLSLFLFASPCSVHYLDGRERHADASQLNTDIVCSPVLDQQNLIALLASQLPQRLIIHQLHVPPQYTLSEGDHSGKKQKNRGGVVCADI